MEDYNKNPDEDTSSIIEDARRKLEEINSEEKGKHEKIKSESKGKKKKIILDLATDLEGKFREDTIAIVLVHGLKGVASERFIRQCLPEKYKQKHRVENAKKQKKNKAIKVDEKLAVLPPLNSEMKIEGAEEEEEEKKKIIAMVANNGSSVIVEDDVYNSDKTNSNNYVGTSIPPEITFDSSLTQDDKQEQLKNNIGNDFKDTDVKEHLENPEKASTLLDLSVFRNNILIEVPVSVYENNIDKSNDFSYLNFTVNYNEFQKLLELFKKMDNIRELGFHIHTNKNNKKSFLRKSEKITDENEV